MQGSDYLTAVLALILVVGLIAALAWGVRRLNLVPGAAAFARGSRRLSVVEVTPIDVRRKLVLVRCDDTEHLLLIGQQGDLVVEADIAVRKPKPARADAVVR
jgi:flagellar protein FliO/FliZ